MKPEVTHPIFLHLSLQLPNSQFPPYLPTSQSCSQSNDLLYEMSLGTSFPPLRCKGQQPLLDLFEYDGHFPPPPPAQPILSFGDGGSESFLKSINSSFLHFLGNFFCPAAFNSRISESLFLETQQRWGGGRAGPKNCKLDVCFLSYFSLSLYFDSGNKKEAGREKKRKKSIFQGQVAAGNSKRESLFLFTLLSTLFCVLCSNSIKKKCWNVPSEHKAGPPLPSQVQFMTPTPPFPSR